MNINEFIVPLKQELIRYEGYRAAVYLDTLGLPTVGIGHMDRTMIVGTVHTPQQIDRFFIADVVAAIKITDSLRLNLDDFRYRVLVNLCFNLGHKITQFSHFLAACKAKDWATAAKALKDSKWYTQVGHRGPEMCYAIEYGRYEWE